MHFSFKIWHLEAAISIIFLIINLPNFVQFKQYQGKSGPRRTTRCIDQTKIFQIFQTLGFSLKAKAKAKTWGAKVKTKAKTFTSCPRGQGQAAAVVVVLVFTALHVMQTRYSDENSVRPSVRLSVRLSHACIVTKRKKDLSKFLYHTKDNLA